MDSNARGFRTEETAGTDRKAASVCALAADEGLSGLLLSTQHNFAWLTGGRTNRVDAGREGGVAHLLVAADGRRWVLTSNIEAERMAAEVLAGLPFTVAGYPWQEERADPELPVRMAAALLGGGDIGADTALPGARQIEPAIARIRSILDASDVPRYRALAAAATSTLGGYMRAVEPDLPESQVAAGLAQALIADDMRPFVLLVGSDERIARYRHPHATDARWRRRLLVALCAERGGLVVALSRLVTREHDAQLEARMRACADVFARMVDVSVPGVEGRAIYEAAASAYAAEGFPGEERRHHQGGVIAYRSREWIAHPASRERIAAPQACAWNPTITGTKVEETILVQADGRFDVLTHDPAWPSHDVDVRGQTLHVPVALVRDV